MNIAKNLCDVGSLVRPESSGLSVEVFFFMAVWAQEFDVFRFPVEGNFVDVMNLEDFGNGIISALLAFMRTRGEYLLALCLDGASRSIKRPVGSKFSRTFRRAEKSFAVSKFMWKAKKFLAAYHARLLASGGSTDRGCISSQGWQYCHGRALAAAKSIRARLQDALFLTARFAVECPERPFVPVSRDVASLDTDPVHRIPTAACAGSFFWRRPVMVREIVVFSGTSSGHLVPAPAGAKAKTSWVCRRACPKIGAGFWSTFWHGLDRLSGRIHGLSLAAFSSADYMLLVGYLQGESA